MYACLYVYMCMCIWASAKKMANFLALIKVSDKSHADGYLKL